METYIIIIEPYNLPQGNGVLYGAFVPDVPGCTATGKTLDEVLSRTREALDAAFRALCIAGRHIPQAHSLEEQMEQFRRSNTNTSLLGTNSIVAMIDVQVAYQQIARAA
jgi:predicted RNase H-like HicB family nuclease